MEAVQLLLEYKADVAVKNTYGQSPLDHAVDNMNSDVVTVMLRNKRCCLLATKPASDMSKLVYVLFITELSLFAVARPSVVCLSVCRLSVTFVRPTQAAQIFGNISMALGTLAIH